MNTNVEQNKVECNGETFTRGTYNGISVIIRDKDGYINATEMCNQFNKRFRKIFENHSWKSFYEAFKREYTASPEMGEHKNEATETEFLYQINKGITKEFNFLRGTYVDPRLINYIAFWASPSYAVTVCKIMDSINEKVHETLNEQQLDDTPENAKPIFNEVVKQIAPSIQTKAIEKQCWGYRDSAYELDCWEKDELRTIIHEYEKIKDRLNEQEKKLDEYGSFVQRYFPEFKK